MLSNAVINEIKQIVGVEYVLTTKEELLCYAYDSTPNAFLPDLVVRPCSTAEVQKIIKLANEHLFPVVPRGAGTGLSGGSLPVAGGVVVDLTRMNKILEIDAENLVAVVEPGVITYSIQEEAEKIGLFYPPDPASLKTGCRRSGSDS